MKKVIVASILATLALSSTAFAAAPAMNLNAGQLQVGYTFSNLNTSQASDWGNFRSNDYQLAYGLGNKLAITGNYLDTNAKAMSFAQGVSAVKYDDSQFGLQYQLSKNIAVTVGSLKSDLKADALTYGAPVVSASTTETFGGIAYRESITSNLDGYASYVRSANVEDIKAGVTYGIGDNTSLDVGYRHFKNDAQAGLTAEGIGFGLNHRF